MGLAVSVPSCPREQLRSLSRAELEGRLENALVIIEVLVLQLRNWQESQRSLPSVGPAKQRDAPAQTDITWSQGVSRELRVEENWGLVPLQLCYRADEFAVFEPFPWSNIAAGARGRDELVPWELVARRVWGDEEVSGCRACCCPPLGGADLPRPLPGAAQEDPGSAAAAGRRAGAGAGAGAGDGGDGAWGRVASTWDSAGHLTCPVPPVLARPEHPRPRPFPRKPGPGRASSCAASRSVPCRACRRIREPWHRR